MSPEDRARVVAEARSWLDAKTPYHHHARIKGAGVDCAQLLCGVYEACGLVPHVETGHYPTNWHLHRSEEMFLGWLKRYAVPTERPQAGDCAVFRFGRTFSHGAVMIAEDACIHSYIGRGVMLNRLNEAPLAGREVMFWSIR